MGPNLHLLKNLAKVVLRHFVGSHAVVVVYESCVQVLAVDVAVVAVAGIVAVEGSMAESCKLLNSC